MSYCTYVDELPAGDRRTLHKSYHDERYGFALHDDNELFGRLILEINQAGLSWETILKKEVAFRKAYSCFNIDSVAQYSEADYERLITDAGIIRNKRKVSAAIENAQQIIELRKEFGSFQAWLLHYHPQDKDDWVKLFKRHFKFMGPEIVGEFLMSTGYLPGAHDVTCPVYQTIVSANTQPTYIQ